MVRVIFFFFQAQKVLLRAGSYTLGTPPQHLGPDSQVGGEGKRAPRRAWATCAPGIPEMGRPAASSFPALAPLATGLPALPPSQGGGRTCPTGWPPGDQALPPHRAHFLPDPRAPSGA